MRNLLFLFMVSLLVGCSASKSSFSPEQEIHASTG